MPYIIVIVDEMSDLMLMSGKEIENYIQKFRTLTESLVSAGEQERFLSVVSRLPTLNAVEVSEINVVLDEVELGFGNRDQKGLF